MELKCVLMWLLFGSIKGNKPEQCPDLPRTDLVDVDAESYSLGTRLYYDCDDGYTRRSGQYSGIRCQLTEGIASWVYKEFECVDKKILLSTAAMTKSDFVQKSERKTQSPAPQKQENISGFDQKNFCGPPKTIPHASLRLNNQYYVGQVLHVKCQSSYDKQFRTSGTLTCKKVNGKITWTPLNMRCTNDSSKSDEWPPQTIEPDLPVSLRSPVQSVPDSTHPSFTSSVILLVTAIFSVLFIIPAVFG